MNDYEISGEVTTIISAMDGMIRQGGSFSFRLLAKSPREAVEEGRNRIANAFNVKPSEVTNLRIQEIFGDWA